MSGSTGGPARVTALATHPIQYHAPWFRALAAAPEIELEVLFEHLPDAHVQGQGFARAFHWDVPLLEGYRWRALGRADGRRARLAGIRALARHLSAERPHVLLLTGWQSTVLLAAPSVAGREGIPCLVRGETNALRPRSSWRRFVHAALLARYQAFLAIGTENRRFYESHGIDRSRLFDCPYCVDNGFFDARCAAARRQRTALRARFGIPAHALCFVFVGKLEAKKRVGDLVAAFAALGERAAHLLIVGGGPLERELERNARGLAVSFAGFLNQSRVPEAYAAADCLVLPSDHGETWGLVVNEAMAGGLPAIVSDQVGCAADLVRDASTGWVFPAGDVGALTTTLREAAARAPELPAMGAAARERVRRRFSVEAAAGATVDAVRRLADGGLG